MNNAKHESAVAINRQQMYENIIGHGCNVEIVVRRLLTILGFKSKLLGTKYLEYAILYRFDNANRVFAGMTHRAYVSVAKTCQTTSTRVERAIRNTIINCFNYGALKSFNTLAQARIIDDYAPSNGEFISSVVNWLQLEKQSGHIRNFDVERSDIGKNG